MTKGLRRSHDFSFYLAAIILILTILACNLPTLSNNPDQSPPNNGSSQVTPDTVQPASGAQASCLAGIIPGTTTRNEVVALLGEPAGTDTGTGTGVEVLFYYAQDRGQFNSIAIQNETVAMVSVNLGENDLQQWSATQEEYGEPAHTTYSNYLQNTMTYIFPEKGLAFVADQAMDMVFIKQCFIPMKIDDYMNTWGKSLPTEDPFIE